MGSSLDFITVGILTRPPRVVYYRDPPIDLYPHPHPHPTPSRQVQHHWISLVS
jgi:hypothetical protein